MQFNKKAAFIQNKKVIVGIDIAKNMHYASIINANTIKLKVGIGIANTRDGFEKFDAILNSFDKNAVVIGMEPTGHYWKPLANYFKNKGYDIVLVNPYHVKSSKELYDNHKSKNDIKDSVLIAYLVRDGKYLECLKLPDAYSEQRQLTLAREQQALELTRSRNQLIKLLDEYLPEMHPSFSDVTGAACLALLKTFPLTQLKSAYAQDKKIACIVKTARGRISHTKAQKVIASFSQSIGIDTAINAAEFSINLLINNIDAKKQNIKLIEEQMEIHLNQMPEAQYLLDFKGVGVITASTILGQTGPFSNFSHAKEVLKVAGLLLGENSSGKFKGQARITKRGRPLLRLSLYRAAVSLIANNVEFKKLYEYKKKVLKKISKVALIAIAAKFFRIIFGMVKNKQQYQGSAVLKDLPIV